MNITLSNINWLTAIPLGFASLLFLSLGGRRLIRFMDHESNSDQRDRLRDIFLSMFDFVTMMFATMMAISPSKLWLGIIPIGLGMAIFIIPFLILGSYFRLYFIDGFMPKNAGIKVGSDNSNEKTDGKVAWYEFIPFVFMLGWLMFFLVNIAVVLTG